MTKQNDMTSSIEFITLVDERCVLALKSSDKYSTNEKDLSRLLELLRNIDKNLADELDDAICNQQAVVEELVYRQGMKDTFNLMK